MPLGSFTAGARLADRPDQRASVNTVQGVAWIAVMVGTGRLLTWMPAGRNAGRNAKQHSAQRREGQP